MSRPGARLCLILAIAAVAGACAGRRVVAVDGAATARPRLAKPKGEAIREFDAGLRALRLGGPEAERRAAERFGAAVKLDAQLWEAHHNLGVLATNAGDDHAALAAFDDALRVNPANTPTLLARAEAARRLRRFDVARRDYEAALARDGRDLATRLRLASLAREAGDLDACLAAVRQTLAQARPGSPEAARAFAELGLYYLASDRDELAELVLNRARALDAKSPLAWNALALVSLRRGRDQEAFERFDRATDLDPSFADARWNKAQVLLDAGDYLRAATELAKVLELDPSDIDARVSLGLAYRGLGEHDRAAATWEAVLRAAPRQPDALYALAVLAMDFRRDEGQAKETLARYLQVASDDHPRRRDAELRLKELGTGP